MKMWLPCSPLTKDSKAGRAGHSTKPQDLPVYSGKCPQRVEHGTLDLEVLSLSPTLGLESYLKNKISGAPGWLN